MSYQVLARKWRPKNFKQMVGQAHVLQALINALDNQRLHHAYLFTGTRGVGKTTIARILARCLSCHKGITSEPCGECATCTSISEGRYVDLIEIDAASRTKVEDMRELLDNVQYAPAEGRFKIYLIDEVHMLSSSSFNALLKTLEEPPEHVKFLFATTDPQKLPITILSRCLQFNLKNMPPQSIVEHLTYVLNEEAVGFEKAALWALSRAADGSMRDALSLTDQAIAYGNNQLSETAVNAMLGTVDHKKIYGILDALINDQAPKLLALVADLSEYSPDYASVLASIVSILHRVAIEQAVPGATDNTLGDQETIIAYAAQLSAEDLQLFYQIALVSRKDLAFSPDPRAGFEMALLRMLAFQLDVPSSVATSALTPDVAIETSMTATDDKADASGEALSETATLLPPTPDDQQAAGNLVSTIGVDDGPPVELPSEGAVKKKRELAEDSSSPGLIDLDRAPSSEASQQLGQGLQHAIPAPEEPSSSGVAFTAQGMDGGPENYPATDMPVGPSPISSSEVLAKQDEKAAEEVSDLEGMIWPRQAMRMGLTGMTQNLLFNMYKTENAESITLFVEGGHYRLLNRNHEARIKAAFSELTNDLRDIHFVEGLSDSHETPAMWRARMNAERLETVKENLYKDPVVQALIEEFDGQLIENSVQALGEIS